jgi:D-alanine transaminase
VDTVFLNGAFLPVAAARISPLDRGFLFADAVYEVIPVYGSRLFLWTPHYARLERSLAALDLKNPYRESDWHRLLAHLIEVNGGGDLSVYLEVTRGTEPVRDHRIPADLAPTVFALTQPALPPDPALEAQGMTVVLRPDFRWQRCDIKSTALLANVLLRESAREAGAGEALLVRDGCVLEGTSSNVLALHGNTVSSPPDGPLLLAGVTRDLVLELAEQSGFRTRRRTLTADDLGTAHEVWLTSTRRILAPVTRIEGRPVGSGRPGPAYQRIRAAFQKRLQAFLEAPPPSA